MTEKLWQLVPLNYKSDPYSMKSSPIILGRSTSKCDITIDDPSISDSHIQFVLHKKNLVIHDLDSGNGIFVNGKKINNQEEVKASDAGQGISLVAGNIEFILKYDEVLSNAYTSPLKKENEWFYFHNGKKYGPLQKEELFKAARSNLLLPTDDVWNSSFDYRLKGFEIKGLFEKGVSSISDDEKEIVCPYCWNSFNLEDIHFVSCHPDLTGDTVLGEGEAQRFAPLHFRPKGKALDAKGMLCHEKACPICHIKIPSDLLLNTPPIFISLVGIPASGKSYCLAATTWKLRSILNSYFNMDFVDVDPQINHWITNYESLLFNKEKILKTPLEASHVYRQARINDMTLILPLPCMFFLKSFENSHSLNNLNRVIVLYDNAGEHFQPGYDSAITPVTRHLSRAGGIIFLFDPSDDPRIAQLLPNNSNERVESNLQKQAVLLNEMIVRLKNHLGLSVEERYQKPIVFAISKADLLYHIPDLEFSHEPLNIKIGSNINAVNLSAIAKISFNTRSFLKKYVPEIVNLIESFAETIIYVPISALGHDDNSDDSKDKNATPSLVEIPILYILSKLGFIPSAKTIDDAPVIDLYEINNRYIEFKEPVSGQNIQVPLIYAGYTITVPETQSTFQIPEIQNIKCL